MTAKIWLDPLQEPDAAEHILEFARAVDRLRFTPFSIEEGWQQPATVKRERDGPQSPSLSRFLLSNAV